MVVANGRVHMRYQNICNYRDDIGWSAGFRNALINVMIMMIIIINAYFSITISFLMWARNRMG